MIVSFQSGEFLRRKGIKKAFASFAARDESQTSAVPLCLTHPTVSTYSASNNARTCVTAGKPVPVYSAMPFSGLLRGERTNRSTLRRTKPQLSEVSR